MGNVEIPDLPPDQVLRLNPLVRASAPHLPWCDWGSRGPGFESRQPDQMPQAVIRWIQAKGISG